MSFNNEDYWKDRIHDKTGSLLGTVKFELNEIANMSSHIGLDAEDIVRDMQVIIMAIENLEKTLLQTKPRLKKEVSVSKDIKARSPNALEGPLKKGDV